MNQQLLDILSDLSYARAAFYRRHSVVPYHLMRSFLANEDRLITLLTRFQVAPIQRGVDIPVNLIQTLFGPDAFVGLGQGQGHEQSLGRFWDAVNVGLTLEQIQTSLIDYIPTPADSSELCPICQEGIATLPTVDLVPCHHHMHRACAIAWFTISTKCPVCRADLRPSAPTTTNAVGAGAPGGDATASGGVHTDVQPPILS